MTDALRLEGVSKRYWKLEEQAMLLRSLLPFAKPKRSELWAVRDIDLSIAEGDVVGIIGRNGAGKTTLLRLMAGVTRPSDGIVTVRGRVAPLISVGVGFHREMSGRENIYVNGMILGLTKAEIDRRFDDIVEFAELADFIDTPVKFYSSGMFMRLGFSVAVHTDPQVLLVDEVLAVGDLAFQLKCLDRMRAIRETGATIVFVNHSMPVIRLLCQRAIVMRHGGIAFDGGVEEAIAHHHQILSEDAQADVEAGDAPVVGGVTVLERVLIGPEGPTHTPVPETPLRMKMRVRFDVDVDSPVFHFNIVAEDGSIPYGMQTPLQRDYRKFRAGDEADIELRFDHRLGGGSYRVGTYVMSRDGRLMFHGDPGSLMFFSEGRLWTSGVANLQGSVFVDGVEVAEDRTFALHSDDSTEPDIAQEPGVAPEPEVALEPAAAPTANASAAVSTVEPHGNGDNGGRRTADGADDPPLTSATPDVAAPPELPARRAGVTSYELSIVLPAYNEEQNIEKAIRRATDVADRLCSRHEIIVVDDGSADRTAEVVRAVAARDRRVRLVRHARNLGYGDALRTGFLSSRLDLVFFTDADNQFDLDELEQFFEWIDRADVVAGYRINRRDPMMRRVYALMWNIVVRSLFYVPVRDIDCAFKLFRRDIFDEVDLESVGAMVNTELMVKLGRAGAGVVEIGVHHYPRVAGKPSGANVKVVWRALYELVKMYRRLRGAGVTRELGAVPVRRAIERQ